MLVYKDRSFCSYGDKCHFQLECQRALTQKMRDEAVGLGLPISYFERMPSCFLPKKGHAFPEVVGEHPGSS